VENSPNPENPSGNPGLGVKICVKSVKFSSVKNYNVIYGIISHLKFYQIPTYSKF
jgi:hypothetical protein